MQEEKEPDQLRGRDGYHVERTSVCTAGGLSLRFFLLLFFDVLLLLFFCFFGGVLGNHGARGNKTGPDL